MIVLILLDVVLFSAVSQAQPSAGDCLCFTGNSVNVRDAPCGSVIGSASSGACYEAEGGSVNCDLSGTPYTFYSFTFGSQTGWAANDFLDVDSPARCAGCSGFTLVTRAEWGARPPSSTTFLGTTSKYFIHHSDGAPCFSPSECESQVRGIQNFHMDSNGWSDIGYNFLVGEDGRAYEGRGWDVQGAHASGWNSQAHGICIMGDFENSLPNAAALTTVQNLMQCGISQGHVSSNYLLHGHRNGVCTECPGQALYDEITGWPNFGGGLSGGCQKDDVPHDEH